MLRFGILDCDAVIEFLFQTEECYIAHSPILFDLVCNTMVQWHELRIKRAQDRLEKHRTSPMEGKEEHVSVDEEQLRLESKLDSFKVQLRDATKLILKTFVRNITHVSSVDDANQDNDFLFQTLLGRLRQFSRVNKHIISTVIQEVDTEIFQQSKLDILTVEFNYIKDACNFKG